MSAISFAKRCALVVLAGSLFSACNIEEGLRKTPSVLSPDQVAMIEGPGTRMLAGSYHALMSGGDLLFARPTEGAGDTLTVIDPQQQSACELLGAQRYAHADLDWIAYGSAFDEQGQGEIHFARGNCSALPTSFAHASLPFDITADKEAIVLSDDTLYAVKPLTGEQRSLASGYRGAQRLALPDNHAYVWIVQSQNQLIEFDWDWKELMRLGGSVTRVAAIQSPSSLLVEDGGELDLVSFRDDGSLVGAVVSRDGCEPYAAARDAFTYFSPCAERRLHSLDASHGEIDYGVLDVPPQSALPVALGGVGAERLTRLFMLRDIDDSSQTGALWSLDVPDGQHDWSPADASNPLGSQRLLAEHADLGWLHASGAREGSYVLADVQDGKGRILFLPLSGDATELVASVPHSARNLYYFAREYWFFAHADDSHADLVRICNLAGCTGSSASALVETVAEGVPDFGFASAVNAQQVALLHDVNDGVGNLSIEDGPPVASGVPAGGFIGLYPIMDQGVAYITRYDRRLGSGALEYWNQTLDARGLVAENVSEFIRADWPYMGLVYLVPNGDKAGLWYARGK